MSSKGTMAVHKGITIVVERNTKRTHRYLLLADRGELISAGTARNAHEAMVVAVAEVDKLITN